MGEPYQAHKSEAEAVGEIARSSVDPRTVLVLSGTPGKGADVLVTHKDLLVNSTKKFVDEWRTRPERRTGTARLDELASFVEHVNRHKGESTALFAAKKPAPQLVAIYDYNESGEETDDEPRARFGKHRAIYTCPLSEPWTKWSAADDESMGQQAFAAFVEDNIADVIDPAEAGESAKTFAARIGATFATPAQLMATSRGLALTVNQRVQHATTLASGEVSIAFVEEHQDQKGQPLKVPTAILLGVQVFEGGAKYQIPVRLRYRVASGIISWTLQLYRTDLYLDDAFADVCKVAREGTSLPLFMGTPES